MTAQTKVREDLTLVDPGPAYQADFIQMAREYAREGNSWERAMYAQAIRDFDTFLRRTDEIAHGTNLPPGWVPQFTYWLIRDGVRIVACSHFRPRLNDRGRYEEGHIGYGTRPGERGKGYATVVCRLTLDKARQMGLHQVLITCDSDNLASARVIEKNGGRYENRVVSHATGKLKSRYWIEL